MQYAATNLQTQSSTIPEIIVRLPMPTPKQRDFIYSPAKRKIVKAGRRGGKTVGVGIMGIEDFMSNYRVLYAAPTQEQIARFWFTVCKALEEPLEKGYLYKNESDHIIEWEDWILKKWQEQGIDRSENRIRAKTAWNADTLRGDYADKLLLDEWQLMNEDAWGYVGAPMLMDTNGDVVFIYTPPSLQSRSVSKARDPQHAAKLFKKISALQKVRPDRYAAFHFTSRDNPHLSEEALNEIADDMTSEAYRMEILAEDLDEALGSLWKRATIEKYRIQTWDTEKLPREYELIMVGVDPSATSTGDEAGIIAAGKKGKEGFTLKDASVQGSPLTWAKAAVALYHDLKANKIVAEANNGGEMVSTVIAQVDPNVPVTLVHASRGKQTRAEPVSALAEKGKDHHVGNFPYLEDEMCLWVPGRPSPNRMDAKVWAYTGLGLVGTGGTDWEAVVGGN